jgi:flagellar biogenesis protein FliO
MLFNGLFVPNENGDLVVANDAIPVYTPDMAPGDFGAAFVKMFLTLFALIFLFGISIWFLKRLVRNRMQRGGVDQKIQVIEKRMISPKTMLYLVDIEGEKVLFAESHLEIQQLGSKHSSESCTTFASSKEPQGWKQ